MREILFRGKRIDNGEWVFGFYSALPDCVGIVHMIETPKANPDETNVTYFVDPSTVGQFTGLTDQSGKRIFDGDIVNMNDEDWVSLGHPSQICAVKFDEFTGGFEPFSTYDWDSGDYIRANYCEVVGNIYDNPCLLEGGGEDGQR